MACYFFDYPKELSLHMINIRVQLGGKHVQPVDIHMYYKHLEIPRETQKSRRYRWATFRI